MFVCSPNNPTGNAQPLDGDRLARRAHPARSSIVDEAYIEFGGESALPLVAEHPNVAVVRTFSKAFAMAGARLGYVLDEPRRSSTTCSGCGFRTTCRRSPRRPASSRCATRAEALALLDAIRAQRDRIVRELASIAGMTVFPSDANFVLFVPPEPHDAARCGRRCSTAACSCAT